MVIKHGASQKVSIIGEQSSDDENISSSVLQVKPVMFPLVPI